MMYDMKSTFTLLYFTLNGTEELNSTKLTSLVRFTSVLSRR